MFPLQAANAKVSVLHAAAALSSGDPRTQKPAPAATDVGGRFELTVHRGIAYTLLAEHEQLRSFSQLVMVETTSPPEVASLAIALSQSSSFCVFWITRSPLGVSQSVLVPDGVGSTGNSL